MSTYSYIWHYIGKIHSLFIAKLKFLDAQSLNPERLSNEVHIPGLQEERQEIMSTFS